MFILDYFNTKTISDNTIKELKINSNNFKTIVIENCNNLNKIFINNNCRVILGTNLPNLTYCLFSKCDNIIFNGEYPNLEEVHFYCLSFDINLNRSMFNIKRLIICYCNFDDKFIISCDFNSIVYLDIRFCNLTSIIFNGELKSLIELKLSSNELKDIEFNTELVNLKKLLLNDNHLTDLELKGNCFSNLELFDISNNYMDTFYSLVSFNKMKHFKLDGNNLLNPYFNITSRDLVEINIDSFTELPQELPITCIKR